MRDLALMARRPAGAPPEARLTVRLTPRAGRDAVEGWARDEEGRPLLRVRVAAPPVDGAANAALERLIADALGLGGGAVRIAAGHQGRVKRLVIAGADAADLAHAFGAPG